MLYKEKLSEQMRCAILTNSIGNIMVIHDQPLNSPVQWLELDTISNKLFLVYEDGDMQDFGYKIEADVLNNIRTGQNVDLAYFSEGEIKSKVQTSFIFRDM